MRLSFACPAERICRGVGLGQGLQEHEMRSRLGEGGAIRGVFVVEIKVGGHTEYLPYFRTSWSPSFRPMRTSRTKVDRS